jgi:hypothetical protein
MRDVEWSDLTRIKPNTKRENLCDRRARDNPFFLFLLFFEIEGSVLHVRARVLKFNNICNVHTNITVKRVRVDIVALKKQKVLHILCVCSLNYPACKAHALYYTVIWGLSGSTFCHINLINGTFSGKMSLKKICVSIFFTNFARNVSHSKKNSTRYYHKCTQVFV